MRILIAISILLISCNRNSKDQNLVIRHIDSIVDDYTHLIHKVVTDTMHMKNDTIYKHYEYNNPFKLISIFIEETATKYKYISYVSGDTLLKIVVKNPNPNYSSDVAAVYYIVDDTVIKKIEAKGKLDNIERFINDQKRNIIYFQDTLAKR